MAEYIDKDIAIQICMDSWNAADASQDIKDEQPADVVEREKIDKAIEEMNQLADHKIRPISFDQSVAIDMCIDILKRNIGEKE